jgi:hypothetical protein
MAHPFPPRAALPAGAAPPGAFPAMSLTFFLERTGIGPP